MLKLQLEQINLMMDQTLLIINIAYKQGKITLEEKQRRVKGILNKKARLAALPVLA